jgi:hypothetical protein
MNFTASAKTADIHAIPGRALGIWALVLAFLLPVVGLVLGIVAQLLSRRADVSNNLAIAGIVVGAVFSIAAVITTIALWASDPRPTAVTATNCAATLAPCRGLRLRSETDFEHCGAPPG